MSRNTPLEPFPALSPRQFIVPQDASDVSGAQYTTQRRRRKSSGLPGDPRGDTGAAALSTMTDHRSSAGAPSPPISPVEKPGRPFARGYKRRKAKSMFRRWKSISLRHTWLNPLIVCLTVLSIYAANPTPENPVHAAIFPSYPIPKGPGDDPSSPTQYGKGGLDFAFVAFYIVVFSFTREFLMQRVMRPLVMSTHIKSRAKQSRFMEQGYTAMYFGIFGPLGLYIMSRSPIWYFNPIGMFENFPHRQHEGLFKVYYLLQAAYWAQQAIVILLQLEKPRKDYKELVAHHIITLALIWCSYRFHFAYMGLAVYITHDISDFFLATSKCLNYLDHPFTGPYFAFFICVWAYGRHYLNLRILYAVLTTFKTVGPFELNWETQQYKCWISQYITFSLLASLQAVNLFWFFLILRIAKRFLFDHVAEDERSEYGDDEDTGSKEETTQEKRERFGIPPEKISDDNPIVLLNGEPVANGHSVKTNSATGTQLVEVTLQERKKARE